MRHGIVLEGGGNGSVMGGWVGRGCLLGGWIGLFVSLGELGMWKEVDERKCRDGWAGLCLVGGRCERSMSATVVLGRTVASRCDNEGTMT